MKENQPSGFFNQCRCRSAFRYMKVHSDPVIHWSLTVAEVLINFMESYHKDVQRDVIYSQIRVHVGRKWQPLSNFVKLSC